MRRQIEIASPAVKLLQALFCITLIWLAAGCGSVSESGDDAGTAELDAGELDAGAEARVLRVFHLVRSGDRGRLFSTDVIDGIPSVATELSGQFTNPDAQIGSFTPGADGSVVVFQVDAETAGVFELFVVRLSDTSHDAPVRISGDHGSGGVLHHFLTSDGTKAIYAFGTSAGGFQTIDNYYVVDLRGDTPGEPLPLGGGQPLRVGELATNGSMFAFLEAGEAFVVDLRGDQASAATRIGPTPGTGSVLFVALSADGSRATLVGDLETNGVSELFAVALDGVTPAAAIKVNQPMVAGGDVSAGSTFLTPQRLSADGERVFYFADAITDGVIELFAAELGGAGPTPPIRLNGPLVAGGAIDSLSLALSGDGQKLLYRADERIDEVFELFLADLGSGQPSQRVSGAMADGGDVSRSSLASDGETLAYIADQRFDLIRETFLVDLSGALPGPAVRVSGDLGDGNSVSLVQALSPDSRHLVYVSDERVLGQFEAMLVPILDGAASAAVPVQEPTNPNSRVVSPAFSDDGDYLIYVGSTLASELELWLVDLRSGSPSPARKLSSQSGSSITFSTSLP